jgi:pyrroloquinoline quinone biosynthesis protein B
MHVVLLGAAAGGGFPQWNCWCPVCRAARETPPRALPRTQSSIAVSIDGAHWFLGNACPDVRGQLEPLVPNAPAETRHSPVEGVVFSDAELDHTLGVPLLRESRELQIWATRAVRDILTEHSRLLPTTQAFARVRVTELGPGRPEPLLLRDGAPSGLTVEAVPVAGDPPRFAPRANSGHTSALIFREPATASGCAFVPSCGAVDTPLLALLGGMKLVFFDGTCYTDDEMLALGVSDRSATAMGHLPISGRPGSLELLRVLAGRGGTRVVYTHLNNTNPVLIDGSAERRAVESAGIIVGADGMRFTV